MTPAEADGLLFDGTTHCADAVPLGWTPGPGAHAEVLQERNSGVLRVLTRLGDHAPEHDEKNPREADIARVDAKLDLVLELVGTLLTLQRPPPPVVEVRMSSRGLVWNDAPALAEGTTGRVMLHLHPALPQPLELDATVIAVDDLALPRRAWLHFDHIAEPLGHELERYTFRRHRRAVAAKKR